MCRHILCISWFAAMSGMVVAAAADTKAPEPLTSAVIDRVWTDFGRHDDEGCLQAFPDMERLIKAPDLAVPFLSQRLKPAASVDLSAVPKLVADLDSNDFSTRDKAFKALTAFGGKALPLLERKLQEKDISLELQNSLKRLVQGASSSEGGGPSAADLRAIRGIQVLEGIGTPPARAVLENVAKGDEASPLTGWARDALKNLDRRNKK